MVLSKMERTENTAADAAVRAAAADMLSPAADAAVRAAAADMLSRKSENRRILLLKSRHTENFVINICYFCIVSCTSTASAVLFHFPLMSTNVCM